MAYITGLATEPVFDGYVDIENESLEKKLVSVCQDIVFLSSRVGGGGGGGEANTKTCCTGNDGKALDWLNQSDYLLNGLGHSVSWYRSSKQTTGEKNTDTWGFWQKNKQIHTLVFDNSDFPEDAVREGSFTSVFIIMKNIMY